ncbi:MAG TPA: hypothetical protein VHI96_02040 [Solirubrobacterales bacterium]|nr:hypothetical protein [Solirubrobacterales bacterium]
MSLYRQSGGSGWRVALIAAAVALLIGGGIGYAIGRGTAPEPSLADQVADLQARLQPTLDGLALVPDHYAQGVKAGGEVQYEGAVQQATAARDGFAAEADDLQALDPAAYADAEQALGELHDAIEAREPPSQVSRLAQQAQAAVSTAGGMTGNGSSTAGPDSPTP